MTCAGFYLARIRRSPIPGEARPKPTTTWAPCRLRDRHDGPCGPAHDHDLPAATDDLEALDR